MRKVILNRIVKRLVYGSLFILASYLIVWLGLQRFLLDTKFDMTFLDFAYVLFVSFLPDILSWTGYGILFSIVFLLLRYKISPIHKIERRYLAIKGGNLVKSLFISGILVVSLFIIPYFVADPPLAGEMVSGMDQFVLQLPAGLPVPGEAGILLSNIISILMAIVSFFVIKPLFVFSSIRLDAFLSAVFMSGLFYHTFLVSLSTRHVSVSRHISKHLCQQGDKIVLRTKVESGFPSPGLALRRSAIASGKTKKIKTSKKGSISCTSTELTEELVLNEGYYNFDIVPVTIFTLPFFHTTVYKVCDAKSDLSVVPALKYKTMIHTRKPIVARQTGGLIRRQLGSSLDFADLREYTHDDPLSRIWWPGLAKQGEMLVKEFHSFAEDRWMLVLDFTNPNLSEDKVKSMLQFSRIFIEMCTRKDIAVGLSTFSPTFHYMNYEVNKRDLLSGLTKVTMPMYEVSSKGVELILKDALGHDMDKLKSKCRKKHMTLPMVYSYSGLGQRKSYFSWKGRNVFKDSMKKFFMNLKRSGKIVMVTDGSPKNMDMFKRFKSICTNRRCRYLLVVTESKKDVSSQLRKSEVKHIYVPYDKLAKPNFVMDLVTLV